LSAGSKAADKKTTKKLGFHLIIGVAVSSSPSSNLRGQHDRDSSGDSSTDSSWSDGQGPILQAYPFCENSTPEKKKKKITTLAPSLVKNSPQDMRYI
jgi:hypothetical protein